jgi:serine/threonine-protein kinase
MNSEMRASRTPWLAVLLSLAGIVVAVMLVREHLTAYGGDDVSGPFCGGGGYYDCARVAAHPTSWAFGVPTAAWGMLFYVAMAVVSLFVVVVRGAERAAAVAIGATLATAALAMDAWLAWVMLVQIGTVCLMCVATYAINLALAGIFWALAAGAEERRDWRGLLLRWTPEGAAGAGGGIRVDPKVLVVALGVAGFAVAGFTTGSAVVEAHAIADFEARTFFAETDSVRLDMHRFDGQPSRGPADAPVVVAVAGEFQCTWCRGLTNHLERLRQEFPDRIRVIFVNAPLSAACNPMIESQGEDHHAESCVLHEMAECALLQGKFWEYHDFLYDRIPLKHVTPANVERLLPKMGIDPGRMKACLEGGEARAALERDVAIFNELELSSTPMLAVNGRMKVGGISQGALRTIVLRMMESEPAGR